MTEHLGVLWSDFDQKAGFYLEKDENEDEGAAGDDATAEDGPGQGRSLTKSTQKTAVKPDEEDIIVKWERQFGGGRGAQHAHAVSSSVGRSKRAMRRHAAHRASRPTSNTHAACCSFSTLATSRLGLSYAP